MAIIAKTLFTWQVLDSSSDIFRFHRLLEGLDDGRLIARLKAERKGRRNDYPVEAMWNSLLAGLVFGHASVESLRRELRRNAELRQVCGFDPILKEDAVPTKDAYYRFRAKLDRHHVLLREIFNDLVRRLSELLPDLGVHLAADGKAIKASRRDDRDAAVGCKRQGHPDDEMEPITHTWLGYKVHMLCDATHELPLAFEVTSATTHESPRLLPLLDTFRSHHKEIATRTETLMADRGYDNGSTKQRLHEEYGIAPIIPSRALKEGVYEALDPARHDTIYLSPTGQVSCKIHPGAEDQYAPMYFMGYEQKRKALKFRCPAVAWGYECHNRDACQGSLQAKQSAYGRVVRVPLERDYRLFGPIYPHSYKYKDLYARRTSVERLFSRLDHQYGFERHYERGLVRVQTRMTMALIAMLATAVGWMHAGKGHKLRRIFQAA